MKNYVSIDRLTPRQLFCPCFEFSTALAIKNKNIYATNRMKCVSTGDRYAPPMSPERGRSGRLELL